MIATPKFVVAIPSYQRSEKQQTLEYLEKLGFPKERIYIFTQTASDFTAYNSRYASHANVVLVPAPGIAQARNNIINRFRYNSNVLMMDDDIATLSRLSRDNKLVSISSGDQFVAAMHNMFSFALRENAPLFGIYPVHNNFFMSNNISTAVTVNTVLGFVKNHELSFNESYRAKEDIELCGKIINNGGKVLRFNFIAPNARHRTNAGGCHNTWVSSENRLAVNRLCETYPTIFAPNNKNPDEVRVICKDVKIQLGRK